MRKTKVKKERKTSQTNRRSTNKAKKKEEKKIKVFLISETHSQAMTYQPAYPASQSAHHHPAQNTQNPS
jgi:hypothetical protein